MSNDSLLRRNGWQIHSRPAHGPILWRKGNRVETEEFAVALATVEDKREAKPIVKLPAKR